jgi:hypothetical protein
MRELEQVELEMTESASALMEVASVQELIVACSRYLRSSFRGRGVDGGRCGGGPE